MSPVANHTTVLLQEAVDALVWDADGYYVDGTFGRGGHSKAILARLSTKGKLLAIDKDPQAAKCAEEEIADARFEIVHESFRTLAQLIIQRGQIGQVSGVLLDLGVSSPQLDDAKRGFSFQQDGPLDMRMDSSQGQSATAWIATVKENELTTVLKEYGEEKFARRIAGAIVEQRDKAPITRTKQLADIVATAHPAWEVGKHPATQTFLAIRLYLNRELEDLQDTLDQVLDVLRPGGRLVVISFHSLEDRIVKRFMRNKARGDELPRGVPVKDAQLNRQLKICGKAIRPSQAEVDHNVRARSAIMRVAEKLTR